MPMSQSHYAPLNHSNAITRKVRAIRVQESVNVVVNAVSSKR